MTTKAQKRTINLALKVAIVESGKTSRIVAQRARIGEVRLSAFVNRRLEPNERERKALAKELGRPQEVLFPVEVTV